MALLPENQKDQVKVFVGFLAVALTVAYYLYPYATRETEIEAAMAHVEALEATNRKAAREFASGSLEVLRAQAAQNRSSLKSMSASAPVGAITQRGSRHSGSPFRRPIAWRRTLTTRARCFPGSAFRR